MRSFAKTGILLLTAAVLLLSSCASAGQTSTETLPGAGDTYLVERPLETQTEPTSSEEETSSFPEVIAIGEAPEESAESTQEQTPGTLTEEDFSLTIGETVLSLGIDFTQLSQTLAQELEITPRVEQGQACIGDGYDTNYYYGDALSIYTLAGPNGEQIIYDIYVTGEAYATNKAAAVGTATQEEIYTLYGMPSETAGSSVRYYSEDGSRMLTFTFSGSVLSSYDILDITVA